MAILTGVPGAYNLGERVRGFKDGIAPYPDIRGVATAISNDDINLGVQVVEETMRTHPNLDDWFFVGMWPLFADLGSMPLCDGYLSGLVGQKYWGWGYDTVQIIYDHVVNDKTYPPSISSGMDIVTRNNVDAMIRAWETNDFGQLLPDP